MGSIPMLGEVVLCLDDVVVDMVKVVKLKYVIVVSCLMPDGLG